MGVYGIRSIVRLKRVENLLNRRMKESPFSPISNVSLANGEDNKFRNLVTGGNGLREQIHEVPCQLVKGGTEAINEVSNGEGDFLGSRPWGNYEKVLRSIAIVMFPNGVRIALNPAPDFRLGKLEVKVCPFGFHVDVFD
jgi:hypothetical protein